MKYYFNFIAVVLISMYGNNIYAEEYTVTFKNSLTIYWGGDPVCNCPWPEESYFIDAYSNRSISFADVNNIINKYYTKQKSFESRDERGGKDIWKLKSAYRNKRFRITIKYERCREDIDDENCRSEVSYNNHLKSIYQID